ncbi:glycerophosphodiester phosphodiesterase family protein [Paenibacillus lupini]|uniref:glycerophosphodiester phosphodiesterase family protein n=1 Tax=Paenibacillus lupini TaxID=1450204 RepID=UPI0014249922|nr:glycerophosphodiester phosphodiesterase family protein [Paenibacillus lupini]NIK23042.1 glycerophosphoryl diester phosphodiesterase [Paenibacillus lupini]
MNSHSHNHFDTIYSDYSNANGSVMFAAHRGNWRRASENSLRSIQSAIDLGMDIVELDIWKTKDGALVLMHDDTVDRMTNGSGKISELTFQEIRSLRLKQGRGGPGASVTDELVPTLQEAMLLAKDRIMVNLDKCWNIRENVYRVLVETGTVRQGLFKSDASIDEVEEFLNGKAERPEFIQKIQDYQIPAENEAEFRKLFDNATGMDEIQAFLSDSAKRAEFLRKVPKANLHMLDQLEQIATRIKPKAIEVNFLFSHSKIMDSEVLSRLKSYPFRIWVNTMFAWDCAGHTDDVSLSNPALGWEWLLNRGANMILTDYPEDLNRYLKTRK